MNSQTVNNQTAQMLASEAAAELGADLRADDAADHEQHGQNDIHSLVIDRLENGNVGGNEDDLEQRRSDHHGCRHAEQIDHCRDHDEAAANTHDCRQQPDEEPDGGR